LMIKELPDTRTTKLVYVDNWAEELKRLARTNVAAGVR